MGGVAASGTGGCGHYSIIIVAGGLDGFGGAVTAGTGDGLDTVICAVCLFSDRFGQDMEALPGPNTVGIGILAIGQVSSQGSAVGIAQHHIGQRNLMVSHIIAILGDLIGLGRGRLLQIELGAFLAGDVRTAGGNINRACSHVHGAAKNNLGIHIGSTASGQGLAGGILDRHAVGILMGIILTNPVVSVIGNDPVAGCQITHSAAVHDQLGAGQQRNILGDVDGAAAVHINADVAVDRQIIVLGIDGSRTKNAKLHGKRQALHLDLAINIDHQTVSCLVIVLYNVSLCHIEHAVGTNERNFRALNANRSNFHSHVAVFHGTGLQGHGHFNILDIVLIEGEGAL